MKRLLVSIALAVACADATDETLAQATPAASEDAAMPLAIEVVGVGTSCDKDRPCQGSAAQCMTRSSTLSLYPEGYCTAECATDAECGEAGVCPVGEAERANPSYEFLDAWPRKCFRSCTPDASAPCRTGYRCVSLAEAYNRSGAPAPMHRNVCIPAGTNTSDAATERVLDGGASSKRDATTAHNSHVRRDAGSSVDDVLGLDASL